MTYEWRSLEGSMPGRGQFLIGTQHEFAAVIQHRCAQSERQIVEVQE